MAKSLKFRAPYALTLAESRAFNRICRGAHARSGSVSPAFVEDAADYVRAASRLGQLHVVLGMVTGRGDHAGESARILQLNRQIDATTALRMRLADRLGLAGVEVSR